MSITETRSPSPTRPAPAAARGAAVPTRRWWTAPLWASGEVVASIGTALIFLAWSRNIALDPLNRRGQVGALAALQFRFALVAIVVVVALVLAHRFLPPARRAGVIAIGCAVIAGLSTGLVAGGIDAALRGTPWGLWAGRGDYAWILDWISKMDRGEDTPDHYPPVVFWVLRWLSDFAGEPAAYAIKQMQLIGTALFGPAAYLTWRLTLRPVWALGIGVVAMLPFIEPVKPYPQLTLVMMVPVLVCYLRTVRRGSGGTVLRALGLGVLYGAGIGLLFLLYSGWFVWCAGGAVAAFLLLAQWRRRWAPTLVLAVSTLVTFVAVAWVHLRGLLATTGATSDNFFYFDTNTEPTYFAMWRNDRPGDIGIVWPPLGELGGVGLFTILLAVGLGVAIWLGWRRTAVTTLGLAALSAWLMRMWLASEQWTTQTVRLYPRTTMILLYCLLLMTGLAVMYAVEAVRRRAAQPTEPAPAASAATAVDGTTEAGGNGTAEPTVAGPPRDRGVTGRTRQRAGAPVGLLLVPLLLVLASAGSATTNRYMPTNAQSHTGRYAYDAHIYELIDGSCPYYGQFYGCGSVVRRNVPSDNRGPVPPMPTPTPMVVPPPAQPSRTAAPAKTPKPSGKPGPTRSARPQG